MTALTSGCLSFAAGVVTTIGTMLWLDRDDGTIKRLVYSNHALKDELDRLRYDRACPFCQATMMLKPKGDVDT